MRLFGNRVLRKVFGPERDKLTRACRKLHKEGINVLFSSPFFPSTGSSAPCGPVRPHYRGFTVTLRHTTLGRTRLDEGSAQRTNLYLHTTQHSQQTDFHVPGGIRTHNPSKRAASDPRLRPSSYRNLPSRRVLTH